MAMVKVCCHTLLISILLEKTPSNFLAVVGTILIYMLNGYFVCKIGKEILKSKVRKLANIWERIKMKIVKKLPRLQSGMDVATTDRAIIKDHWMNLREYVF